MIHWLGNMNGQKGQTGAIQVASRTADFTVEELDGGRVIEVDPTGGDVIVTLPEGTPGPGFFCEVCQIAPGGIVFASPGTLVSSAGATPLLQTQWESARIRLRPDGSWLVEGSIA